MIPVQGFGGPPPLTRVMAFVDGGYLREEFKKKVSSDFTNYEKLRGILINQFNGNCGGNYRGDLIRMYYYDAIVDPSSSDYSIQERYFSEIRKINSYEVRLGRLFLRGENGKGGFKQKGVDVLLAIDMITKAYQNHYEFSILLAGDDDFVDVVKAVKDTGKRVFGFYFKNHISNKLFDALDTRIEIENFVNDLQTP